MMPRALAHAAALLVLAAPVAVVAQEAGPLPRKPAPPAATSPAPSSPRPGVSSSDPEPREEVGALRVAGLLGLEFASGDTGLALRLDGEMKVADVSSQVAVSGVASLGYSHFSDETTELDVTTNLVKFVPAVRITVPSLAPQLGVYGDAGVGFYYASSSVHVKTAGASGQGSNSAVGLALRFAGAAFYEASSRLRLGAELAVNPYFGDFDHTSVSLVGLVSYRL